MFSARYRTSTGPSRQPVSPHGFGFSSIPSTPVQPAYSRDARSTTSQSPFTFGSSTSQAPASAASKKSKPSPDVETGPQGPVAGLLAALNDDTDLTIKLGDHTWKVHSNLMVARSPFFEVLCNGQWKESKDRVVELHGDLPYVFARFIQFVYCYDYDGNTVGHSSDDIKLYVTIEKLLGTQRPEGCSGPDKAGERHEAFLLEHFEVYELADKYGCTDLQVIARENIAKFCGRHLIGELDEMLSHHDLGEWRQVMEKDEKLTEIFARTFASNYRRMRNVVEEEYTLVRGWLRWLEEDKAFCLMVMDAMSKRFS